MKYGLASLVVLAACGAATTRNMRRDAMDALIAARGDPAAFQRMMYGSVVNRGLWFDDPDCMQRFPSAGEVHEAQFSELARCLAKLQLRRGKRRAAVPDTVILTYPPGVEIEARILDTYNGPILLSIGYVGRYQLADALPTISRDALERLRIAGTPDGPLDARVAAALTSEHETLADEGSAYAWLKVCIDTEGKVTSIRAREASSLSAAEAFGAAARSWQFRPFVSHGQPLPVCSLVLMAEPPPDPAKVEKAYVPFPRGSSMGEDEPLFVGAQIMKARRVSGEKLILPDDGTRRAIARAGIRTIVGAFTFCLDETGHVVRVETDHTTGIPRYDNLLVAGIKKWVYKPYIHQDHAVPVCSGATFIYSQ